MANIVDKIKEMDKRLEGLENRNISEGQVLALIQKVYTELDITVKVTVSKHQNWVAGTHVFNANSNLRV